MSDKKNKKREDLLKEVLELIEKHKVTAYEIEQNTSLSAVGVQKIINGDTKRPLTRTLEDITSYIKSKHTPQNDYPPKEEPTNQAPFIEAKEAVNDKGIGVPYYDVEFTSSFLEVTNDQTINPTSYINHPFFSGCDLVVRNSGQSMAKLIAHGDAVGLVKIDNWRDFFPLGEVYAIVTKNNFRMIKVITKGKDDKHYTLISKPTDTKKDEFPPQQIKKDTILYLFKVQASSRLF